MPTFRASLIIDFAVDGWGADQIQAALDKNLALQPSSRIISKKLNQIGTFPSKEEASIAESTLCLPPLLVGNTLGWKVLKFVEDLRRKRSAGGESYTPEIGFPPALERLFRRRHSEPSDYGTFRALECLLLRAWWQNSEGLRRAYLIRDKLFPSFEKFPHLHSRRKNCDLPPNEAPAESSSRGVGKSRAANPNCLPPSVIAAVYPPRKLPGFNPYHGSRSSFSHLPGDGPGSSQAVDSHTHVVVKSPSDSEQAVLSPSPSSSDSLPATPSPSRYRESDGRVEGKLPAISHQSTRLHEAIGPSTSQCMNANRPAHELYMSRHYQSVVPSIEGSHYDTLTGITGDDDDPQTSAQGEQCGSHRVPHHHYPSLSPDDGNRSSSSGESWCSRIRRRQERRATSLPATYRITSHSDAAQMSAESMEEDMHRPAGLSNVLASRNDGKSVNLDASRKRRLESQSSKSELIQGPRMENIPARQRVDKTNVESGGRCVVQGAGWTVPSQISPLQLSCSLLPVPTTTTMTTTTMPTRAVAGPSQNDMHQNKRPRITETEDERATVGGDYEMVDEVATGNILATAAAMAAAQLAAGGARRGGGREVSGESDDDSDEEDDEDGDEVM